MTKEKHYDPGWDKVIQEVEGVSRHNVNMERLKQEEKGWKCPNCGQKLIKEISDYDVYQCHNCGLAWRITDTHPLTHMGEFP
jgi:DNA-directed RNA polymerase subunit RPC12/RpoP